MSKDHWSQYKGAWGFKCEYCGHEYSDGAGGCDGCRVCASCGKSGGCYNKIFERSTPQATSFAHAMALEQKKQWIKEFSDQELIDELKRRGK